MGYSLGATVAAAQALFVEGAGNTATGIATPVLAIGGPPANNPSLGDGYLSVAANNALKVDVSATATIAGFVWGLRGVTHPSLAAADADPSTLSSTAVACSCIRSVTWPYTLSTSAGVECPSGSEKIAAPPKVGRSRYAQT